MISIKGSDAQKQRPHELLLSLGFDNELPTSKVQLIQKIVNFNQSYLRTQCNIGSFLV